MKTLDKLFVLAVLLAGIVLVNLPGKAQETKAGELLISSGAPSYNYATDLQLSARPNLSIGAGSGAIVINFKTGQVDLPKDMKLPDAAVAFWLQVARCFPDLRRAILTGDPTPLTTAWKVGRLVLAAQVESPPNRIDRDMIVVPTDTLRVTGKRWNFSPDETIEIGLRSDGVLVWREVK